jgi:hypothetical protein
MAFDGHIEVWAEGLSFVNACRPMTLIEAAKMPDRLTKPSPKRPTTCSPRNLSRSNDYGNSDKKCLSLTSWGDCGIAAVDVAWKRK